MPIWFTDPYLTGIYLTKTLVYEQFTCLGNSDLIPFGQQLNTKNIVRFPNPLRVFVISLGYRIIAVAAPGMAAQNPFDGQPATLERPVLQDGFLAILRTGGRVPAIGPEKGRNEQLVKPDEQHEKPLQRSFNQRFPKDVQCFHASFSTVPVPSGRAGMQKAVFPFPRTEKR